MTAPYYSDDKVTLYHGDCREIAEWLEADVLVTDPPYGISHRSGYSSRLYGRVADRYQTASGDAIASDTDTDARDTVLEAWGPRPAVVFGSHRAPFPAGYRTALIWDKGEASGMGDLSIPWKPSWEMVFVLGDGFAGRRTGAVLRYFVPPRVSMGRCHPNQKPTSLLTDLLQKCPPGVVADPFAGSGSTLVAAKALGRRAIGVELDEAYCEIAAKRLAQGAFDFGAAS
jgi:hypothetical protein